MIIGKVETLQFGEPIIIKQNKRKEKTNVIDAQLDIILAQP